MNIDNIPGVQETRDFINERLKNPFLSSLAFFWFLFNWQIPFYVIFSNHPIEGRFDYINDELWTFWRSVLLPIIFSFGYYYLRDKFFNYLEKDTKDAFIERKITATDKEVELIRLETKKEKELVKLAEIRARNKEIEELRADKEELNSKIESLKNSNSEYKVEVFESKKVSEKSMKDLGKMTNTFYYFLGNLFKDSTIEFKYRTMSPSDLVDLHSALYIIVSQYKNKIDVERDMERIGFLEKFGVGKFNVKEEVLKEIELTGFGVFLLFVEAFSNDGLADLKLDISKGRFPERPFENLV